MAVVVVLRGVLPLRQLPAGQVAGQVVQEQVVQQPQQLVVLQYIMLLLQLQEE